MPYFARCSNPNLYWISLLEKAYAKLHGRYFALDTGSTDEALEDLISLPVERCVIGSSETMTDRSKLFNTLQVLCYNHCIVGCSIDHELLLQDETEKQMLYQRCRSSGLEPFHMYLVLDVRTIRTTDGSGAPKEVNLVRL